MIWYLIGFYVAAVASFLLTMVLLFIVYEVRVTDFRGPVKGIYRKTWKGWPREFFYGNAGFNPTMVLIVTIISWIALFYVANRLLA